MSDQLLQVKATRQGLYNRVMREVGDDFLLQDAKAFSARWMEPIGWKPEGYEPKPAAEERKRRVGEDEALRNQNRKLLARVTELEELVAAGESDKAKASMLAEAESRISKLQDRLQELEGGAKQAHQGPGKAG